MKLTPEQAHIATAHDLAHRILDLIPKHPEILTLEDAWGLLKIPEFKHKDLSPTLFQVSWALAKAKHAWKEKNP